MISFGGVIGKVIIISHVHNNFFLNVPKHKLW